MVKKQIRIDEYTREKAGKIETVKSHDKKVNIKPELSKAEKERIKKGKAKKLIKSENELNLADWELKQIEKYKDSKYIEFTEIPLGNMINPLQRTSETIEGRRKGLQSYPIKILRKALDLKNIPYNTNASKKELIDYGMTFGFTPKANLESDIDFILNPKYRIVHYTYNYGRALISKKFGFPPNLDDFKYLLSNPVISSDLV